MHLLLPVYTQDHIAIGFTGRLILILIGRPSRQHNGASSRFVARPNPTKTYWLFRPLDVVGAFQSFEMEEPPHARLEGKQTGKLTLEKGRLEP